MKRRIGILGGTFNPVHNGHLRLALIMKESLGLEKVILIPDYMPPHKDGPEGASVDDRVSMLREAAEGVPFLEIDTSELERGGKSYTYYTLKYLTEKDGSAEYYFLTGSDMFLTLNEWYRYEDIMKMAVFCAVPRSEDDAERLKEKKKEYDERGFKTCVLDAEPMVLSSSEIREKIENGESIEGLVPEKVRGYIMEKGLYGKN